MHKTHVTLLSSVLLLFAACSAQTPSNQPVPVTPPTQAAKLLSFYQAKGLPITLIDVGQGKKTSAAFAVELRLGEGDFSTKASLNGIPRKVQADVDNIDVFLLESPAGAAPTGNVTTKIKFGPQAISTGLGGPSRVLMFQNVKENTSGSDEYYVAVRAKQGVANITNNLGPTNTDGIGPISPTRMYVSTTGGNTNTGGVNVGNAPGYIVSSATQLVVGLTLLDSVGATIDSVVNVTNGSVAAPGPVSVN